MNKSISTYSSFNSIPWKLVRRGNLFNDSKIKPLHIRLMPTNSCNASCEWCSYSDVDRAQELPIGEIKKIIDYFKQLGTEAITFSGGGEPTMHPHFMGMVRYAHSKNIRCGLVTNGLLLGRYAPEIDGNELCNLLTWARISVINTTTKYNKYLIVKFADNLKSIPVGISFVVPKGVNIKLAIDICKIANEVPNITHVKFIQDSYDLTNTESMEDLIESLTNEGVVTNKIFFVWRNGYVNGHSQCNVALLKPVIDASGYIYPCCDVQNAQSDVHYPPNNFRMGYWDQFECATFFDGSVCNKCYYGMYNNFLGELLVPTEHDAFL